MYQYIKKIKHKVMFKIKLWEMDRLWELMGGSCWGLFPPSFYYTHTEEEIERITKETIESCKKMLDEFMEQAKQRVANEKKKQNEKKRKAEKPLPHNPLSPMPKMKAGAVRNDKGEDTGKPR